jgi:predicted branched-subunit amino acid permease
MAPSLGPRDGTQELRYGLRVGAGLAVAVFVLALSFGTTAVAVGWPGWLVVLMSAITFTGGASSPSLWRSRTVVCLLR